MRVTGIGECELSQGGFPRFPPIDEVVTPSSSSVDSANSPDMLPGADSDVTG